MAYNRGAKGEKRREKLTTRFHSSIAEERASLRLAGLEAILDKGRASPLSLVLQQGGALLFPHTHLVRCGHQVAACIHALLDSGADQALVLGVLHPRVSPLAEAHLRVSEGGDRRAERLYGVQGPGLDRGEEWRGEFSLLNFCYLLDLEVKRRGVSPPKLWIRYPYLVGAEPEALPGMTELESLAKDAFVLATGDLCHHGLAYRTPPEEVVPPEQAEQLAHRQILAALDPLIQENYAEFLIQSEEARSDWRDVGPTLRYLLGPIKADILDLTWSETTALYDAPLPNWVAAALIAFGHGFGRNQGFHRATSL